jgi:Phage phiEco32-like COOH.NH2 ligase-type 2
MEINGKTYLVGADPEIFVGKNGQFVSAHGLVKGTKNKPTPVRNGAVQVDGMALEFNIDPAASLQEFETNLDVVQAQLKSMIGDLEFLQTASVTFDDEFVKNVPRANLRLGCEPDFNAYNFMPNPRPNADMNMRTAGGHLHVGGFETNTPHCEAHMGMSARLARYLDRTIGVYSLLWDKDDKRRSLYGAAGAYRPKKYGMEYRTMSNAWLFNPTLRKFVYRGIEEALQYCFGGVECDEEYSAAEIEHIINNSVRNHSFFRRNAKAEALMEMAEV